MYAANNYDRLQNSAIVQKLTKGGDAYGTTSALSIGNTSVGGEVVLGAGAPLNGVSITSTGLVRTNIVAATYNGLIAGEDGAFTTKSYVDAFDASGSNLGTGVPLYSNVNNTGGTNVLEFFSLDAGNGITITPADPLTTNLVNITVVESELALGNIGGSVSSAQGGTGLTTFTSGKVVTSTSPSTLATTLNAPTSDVVGIDDAQLLTNKTVPTPTASGHIASKGYVDSKVASRPLYAASSYTAGSLDVDVSATTAGVFITTASADWVSGVTSTGMTITDGVITYPDDGTNVSGRVFVVTGTITAYSPDANDERIAFKLYKNSVASGTAIPETEILCYSKNATHIPEMTASFQTVITLQLGDTLELGVSRLPAPSGGTYVGVQDVRLHSVCITVVSL